MELTRFRILGTLALVALVAAMAVRWMRSVGEERVSLPIPGERDHVEIEVLNVTRVDGLARVTTRRLRRAGIDVVYFGSVRDTTLDSTVILVRRGDSSFVGRIREVLGLGRVVLKPDPTLLVDASVLLGYDLAPARFDH
ncbi:MAG: LytR C-terminal domain-containing protein [Gemmatimonadales bacterium]